MSRDVVTAVARIGVSSEADIVAARQQGRALATRLGFSAGGATMIATAISELARNILLYARPGEVVIAPVERNGHVGVEIVARDQGQGIPDPEHALQDGFSTSGRLGLGLPGVRRLMDEFELDTGPNRGTVVTARKWMR